MADNRFNIEIDVDASKATSALNQVDRAAGTSAQALRRMSVEAKGLFQSLNGGGSFAGRNFLSDAQAKSLAQQAQAMKATTAAAGSLGTALKALNGVDLAGGAQRAAAGFQEMSRAMKALPLMSAGHLRALQEQVSVMKEMAALSKTLGATQTALSAGPSTAASRGASDAAVGLQAQAQAATQAAAQNQRYSDSLYSSLAAMNQVRNTLTALAAGFGAYATAVISAAAQQERAFADVDRVLSAGSGTSRAAIETLKGEFRQLATEFSTSFEELSKIGTLGTQMNIAEDDLKDFTQAVAEFAVVTGVTVDESAEKMGRLVQFFNQAQLNRPDYQVRGVDDGTQYRQLASQIAELGAAAVATEDDILKMSESIVTSTSNVGIGQDATLAYATALTSTGVQAEAARGAFQRVFKMFNSAVAEGSDKLDGFAEVMDLTSQEADKLWRTDPNKFFQDLLKSLHDMDSIQRSNVLTNIGIKNTRDVEVVSRLAQNYDLLAATMTKASEAGASTSFLDESVSIINSTLTETIARAKNSLQNLAATLGEPFLTPIKAFLNAFTGAIQWLSGAFDSSWGRVVASIAGGVTVAIALRLGMAALKTAVLSVGHSFFLMKQSIADMGLSTKSSWGEIIALLRTANVETNNLVATTSRLAPATAKAAAAQKASTAVGAVSGVASAATTAAGTAAAAKGATAAAGAVSRMSFAATAASASMSALGAASRFAGGVLSGIASLGPWGWVTVGITALSAAIPLVQEFSSASSKASEEVKSRAQETAGALGSQQEVYRALVADAQAFEQGLGGTQIKIPVNTFDGYNESVRQSGEAMYWWIDASGKLVQATEEQAAAQGLSATAMGENTKKLVLNAVQQSQAFKDLTAEQRDWLTSGDFDLKGYFNAAAQGSEAADQFLESYRTKLDAELARTQSTTTNPQTGVSTTVVDPKLEAQINAQKEALDALSTSGGGVGDALSLLAGQMALTEAAAEGMGLSTEEATESLAGAGEEAKTAAEAYEDWRSALDAATDAAFANINATSGMYEALDNLSASIIDNGTTLDLSTEAGRKNMEAVQGFIQQTVQFATQQAEQLGLVGEEAQAYVSEQVQAAVDYLGQQGFDTSSIDDAVNNIQGALGQTLQGPTADYSNLSASMDQAINMARAKAAIIASIVAGSQGTINGVGGGSTKGGKTSGGSRGVLKPTKPSSSSSGVQKGTQWLMQGDSSKSRSSLGGSTAQRALSTGVAKGLTSLLKNYKYQPKQTSSSRGGGGRGGGSRTPRSSGGGGGSRSAQKQKTAQELFEDYLSRLSKALKDSLSKFWQTIDAQDGYHTSLSALNKKVQDAKDKMNSLAKDISDLSSTLGEQEQRLRDAQYFNSVAKKYGDQQRIRSTQTDIDSAQNDIAKTQQSIADKKREIETTQQGMYALRGYSDAAIENRKALRDLQAASLDMIEAYAAQGHSTQEVAAFTAQLKQRFIEQAVQLGFNESEVRDLARAFDNFSYTVRNVPTRVDVDVSDRGSVGRTQNAINGIRGGSPSVTPYADTWPAEKQIRGLLVDREVKIKARMVTESIPVQGGFHLRGIVGRRWAGGPIGFAGGGLVPGRAPGNRRIDNLAAITPGGSVYGIRSGEYVINQQAVNYYGKGFMQAVNSMRYQPGPAVVAASQRGPVQIDPNQIHALARAVSSVITLDGRAISDNTDQQWAVAGKRGSY